MFNLTRVFPSVPVVTSNQSLISHAGLNVLTSFVDATGFGSLCEERLSQFVPEKAFHHPGRILGSLAVMLAGGGEHVSDLDVLRNSPGLFGRVPSNATVSRFVERAAREHEREGSDDSSRSVEGLFGNELGEAVFTQGCETGRIQERGQDVQSGVGNQ